MTLTATPNEGYIFLGWYVEDKLYSTDETYTFEATISTDYTAKFRKREEGECILKLLKDPDGVPLLNVYGAGVYQEGTSVTIKSRSTAKYEFLGWYNGDILVSKNADYKFVIYSDITLTSKWSKSTNPYDKGGTTEKDGGDGTYTYDTTPIPYVSGEDNAGDLGFFTIYSVTKDQLKQFAKKMVNTDITDLDTTFAKLFNKPMEAIFGLYITRAPILTKTATTLKVGTWDTGISCNYLVNQWNSKDMGSVKVEEYYGNDLDYTATSMEIWLPYIGFKELDSAEIMGKTLNVKYKFNQLNGDCVAQILVNDSIKYQFEGNVYVSLPYSQASSSAITSASSILLGVAGSVATVASGGAALPAIASAAGGVAGGILTYNKSMRHGGDAGNSSKFLEVQYPVLYIKRPQLNIPEDIAYYKGLPSNITATLGTLTGFTKVRDVHLDGLNLTDDEITELEEILTTGFIIR